MRPSGYRCLRISFKVRGRLVTHGLAFGAVGSQEPNSEAVTLACFAKLRLRSFWDIGANIGYYTWLVKSAAPDVEAILFEPFVPNLELNTSNHPASCAERRCPCGSRS